MPFAFELAIDPARIDPTVTYSLQATIVDGANAWVTTKGVDVLTKGNPDQVDIELTYRPDALKGAVTGSISALGYQPVADAYAIAILLDPETGESYGIDVRLTEGKVPVPFSVPYTITDIQKTSDYVIAAELGDASGTTWDNTAGVPVITKGNPKSGVQVVVTQVVPPTPGPTATPSPGPTAAPLPPSPGGDGGTGPLLALVIIGAIVGIAAAVIARLRPTTPPRGPGRTRLRPQPRGGAAAAATPAEPRRASEPLVDRTTRPAVAPAAPDADRSRSSLRCWRPRSTSCSSTSRA